ncbi:MAG: mechanosensitive ion channel family protein [Plectolyngbya sp. WJT66-NPBG17]|nr:mechanosensitive ion channel family protein [Plectolyngbya sp. WJT66-NPBG17]MBW4524196.1 mechanosensitive ion channel family protein [Phormidium tanganyikae FI6-MK23]
MSILLLLGSSAFAQNPILPTPKLELPQISNTEVRTAPVRLDGRELFRIAVPADGESNQPNQPNQTSAIKVRVQGIEANLNRLVNQTSSAVPEVTSEIDSSSNLPVITANRQYLMTVTTLDAQLQGQEPATYAQTLTQVIRDALIAAGRERRPEFITQQIGRAIAIIVGMFVLSWAVSRLQSYLRKQQKRLQAETPNLSELPPNAPEMASSRTQLMVKQQLANRQQRTMKDVQRRFLQLVQLIIWAAGGFIILGLFAQTRSLQPFVLSTPLKVLGIIVLTYLVIRFSDLLIDRIFSALDISQQSAPDVSQRVALRVSTFSRVVKGLSTLGWISISLTTILSTIGIQILPLLAGAGIIGIGISLASQNLIKDVINGFLILLEDQYAVGDVIQVGTMSGLVESISLRITQIRNAEGRLITIPNSAIAIVENLSKDWSRVDLTIAIAYDADIDRTIHLIEKVGDEISHDLDWETKILEPPQVLGVEDLSYEGVTLRIWIKTQPLQQWHVGREFRKRLKQALDTEGISIGIPQQSFSVRGRIDDEIFDHHEDKNSDLNVRPLPKRYQE